MTFVILPIILGSYVLLADDLKEYRNIINTDECILLHHYKIGVCLMV
jgi:hypothetical protein